MIKCSILDITTDITIAKSKFYGYFSLGALFEEFPARLRVTYLPNVYRFMASAGLLHSEASVHDCWSLLAVSLEENCDRKSLSVCLYFGCFLFKAGPRD